MIHPSPRVLRRTLLGASAALPAAGLLAGCNSSDDPDPRPEGPPDEVTMVTNFGQLGRDAYSFLALEHGLFSDANLEVAIQPGFGTNPSLTVLLGGEAQFVVIDMAGAMIVRSEMEGFKAIAAIHQQPPVAVMAYADSGITSPLDLAGRTVGVITGGVFDLLFEGYAQLAGLDPDTVERVPLEGPQLIPALAADQVDAIGQFVMGQPTVQNAGGGREVVVLPYAEWLDDLYGACVFTTTELIEENPDLCVRFRDALLAGLEYSLDNPEEAAAALLVHNPETNAESAVAELELMAPYCQPLQSGQPLGHLDEARVMRGASVIVANGLAGQEVEDPRELVAFDLAPGGGDGDS